jgi:hypothetical protein
MGWNVVKKKFFDRCPFLSSRSCWYPRSVSPLKKYMELVGLKGLAMLDLVMCIPSSRFCMSPFLPHHWFDLPTSSTLPFKEDV